MAFSTKAPEIKPLDKGFHANILMAIEEDEIEPILHAIEFDGQGNERFLAPEKRIQAFEAVLADKKNFDELKRKSPDVLWAPMEKLHSYLQHPCPQENFSNGGLFALVALEKELKTTVSAEQVHQFLREYIASKIKEIQFEAHYQKSAAEFNEEKIPVLLKKEYAQLTKENEKVAFIRALMQCSTSSQVLNRYQYKPGSPNALANINALQQDINGPFKAFVETAHPIRKTVDRIKRIEENIIAAKTNFNDLDIEDKLQFVLALSRRTFFTQIDFLSKPHIKSGLEQIEAYLKTSELPIANKDQLLKAIEMVSSPFLLSDRSFKELKDEEKQRFLLLLINNDNQDDVLSLLNQQYNKSADNLDLIESALKTEKDKDLPETLLGLIALVRSTPDLLKQSLSELKADRQKQFIHGLLALPSIDRRKLLFEQHLKNNQNIPRIAGWLTYPKKGCKIFNISMGLKPPDNSDRKYDGHYVLSYYFDQKDLGQRLRLHYFPPGLETKRVEIDINDYQKLRSFANKEQAEISPSDIYDGIILNTNTPYSRTSNIHDYFFSKNCRDCFHELSLMKQTGILGEETRPLRKAVQQYQYVYGDARQQFVLQYLMMPPEERRLAVFDQYNHNLQNIKELFASLTTRGPHREDLYKGFESYDNFLHEVKLLANADQLLLNHPFKDLNDQDKELFFVALTKKSPEDRLIILNNQQKLHGDNLIELIQFLPDIEGNIVHPKKIQSTYGLYLPEDIQYIRNEARVLSKIYYQDPLNKSAIHAVSFSAPEIQGTSTDRDRTCNKETEYQHRTYRKNNLDYKVATLFKITYVIGLLQSSSYSRNLILKKHGAEAANDLYKWIDANKKLWRVFNRFGNLNKLNRILDEMRSQGLQDQKGTEEEQDRLRSIVQPIKKQQETEALREKRLAELREKEQVPTVEDSKDLDVHLDQVAMALLAILSNVETIPVAGLIISYFHNVKNVDALINHLKKGSWAANDTLDKFKIGLDNLADNIKKLRLSPHNIDDGKTLREELLAIRPELKVDETRLEASLKKAKLLPKSSDEKESKSYELMISVPPNQETEDSHRIDDIYFSKEGDYLKTVQVGHTGVTAEICSITGKRAEQQDRATVGEAPFCHLLEEKQIDKVLRETSKALQDQCGNPGEGLEEVGSAMTASVAWIERDALSGNLKNLHVHAAHIGSSTLALVKKDEFGNITLLPLTNDSNHTRKNTEENKRIIETTTKNHEITSPTRVGEERLGQGLGAKMTRGLGNNAYEQDGLIHDPELIHYTVPLTHVDLDCKYSLLLLTEGTTENPHKIKQGGPKHNALSRFEHILQKKLEQHTAPPIDIVYEITDEAYTKMKSTNNMTTLFVPVTESPIFSAVFNGSGGAEVADAASKQISYELNSRIQIEMQKNMAKSPVVAETKEGKERPPFSEFQVPEKIDARDAKDAKKDQSDLRLFDSELGKQEPKTGSEIKVTVLSEAQTTQIKQLREICNAYLLKLTAKQKADKKIETKEEKKLEVKDEKKLEIKEITLNDKINAVNNLLNTLKGPPSPTMSPVDAFKAQLRAERNLLSTRRYENDWDRFCKGLWTALGIVTIPLLGAGFFVLYKTWRVEGKEVVKELDKKSKP